MRRGGGADAERRERAEGQDQHERDAEEQHGSLAGRLRGFHGVAEAYTRLPRSPRRVGCSTAKTAMRPAPIRTDSSNAFAHYSMKERVPRILDEVVERNPTYPPRVRDAVRALRGAIAANGPLPPLGAPAPDAAEWDGLAERAGRTWLDCDWFFAETYVYRRLIELSRFWETRRDPFAPAKAEETASEGLWELVTRALSLVEAPPAERIHALLALSLWGNRVDLSYAVGARFGREGERDDLLVDHRQWAVPRLLARGADVHLVADNTGSELAMDLVLADALVSLGGARVTVHVKQQPIFVSDAMVEDVWSLVLAMRGRGEAARALAARLEGAFDDGILRLLPSPFWSGPRFLWERPAIVASELDRASMVIVKGDANYRRVIGDAIWPEGATFGEATTYFPAPMLCVRTMKCDAAVGLPTGLSARLDAVDPAWRVNGRRGLIQGNGAE
jgi:hypothetical protein